MSQRTREAMIEALVAEVDDYDLETLIAMAKEDRRARAEKLYTADLVRWYDSAFPEDKTP